MSLRVSVVVPAYNCARFLREAIDSALVQTLPPIEVIVVDDGSSDETPALLAGYGSRIRAIRQANAGVAAARNRGVREATGDAVAFLDADDAWLPEKLERQALRLETEPDLGFVHCGALEVDEEGRPLRARAEGCEGWVADRMLMFEDVGPLSGSTPLVPRARLAEAGGFDERLSTSADWDLCYRLARGRPVGFVAQPLVRYRVRRNAMHFDVALMEKDMLLAYAKAFQERSPELQRRRGRSYAALHMVLAGSFLAKGLYGRGALHALRGLAQHPSAALRVLAYPGRAWSRRRAAQRGT